MEKKKQVVAIMQQLLTESEKNPEKTVEQAIQDISSKLRKVYTEYPVDSQEN